ncbi:MAG: glycine cleavage system protein GcvH [Deltaproteobacteria bacterium]|jgi:glycine cleavage system H protein|nr:glycine cleavage system protein GcvH [Deltaproteobacteria bacterium]
MIKSGSFYFSKSHEWIGRDSNNKYRIGISDFAQSELGDVVYISLPEAGKAYKKAGKIGEIESVKSVSEIYAPVDLKIISVNSKLNDTPELINQEPKGAGFIAEVEISNDSDVEGLMVEDAYKNFIADSHHE